MLKPQIADTITSLLTGVIQYGTGAANGQIYRPAAGKTGTTDQHYDAWFVGYIPQLAAAVWVGDARNPTLYPMEYPGYIAPGQTVSTMSGRDGGRLEYPESGLRWRLADPGLGQRDDRCLAGPAGPELPTA